MKVFSVVVVAVVFLVSALSNADEIERTKFSGLQTAGSYSIPVYRTDCHQQMVYRRDHRCGWDSRRIVSGHKPVSSMYRKVRSCRKRQDGKWVCRVEVMRYCHLPETICTQVLDHYDHLNYQVNFPHNARLYSGEKEIFEVKRNGYDLELFIKKAWYVYNIQKSVPYADQFVFDLISQGRIKKPAPMTLDAVSITRVPYSNDTRVSFVDTGYPDFPRGKVLVEVLKDGVFSNDRISIFEQDISGGNMSFLLSDHNMMLKDGKYIFKFRMKKMANIYVDDWSATDQYAVKIKDGKTSIQNQSQRD